MNKIKDFFLSAFGVIGYVLWFFASIALTFAPLVILHFNFFINFIIIGIVIFVPFAGQVVSAIIWIWSFAKILNMPFHMVNIYYYIALAIWLFTTAIPFVQCIFLSLFSKSDDN